MLSPIPLNLYSAAIALGVASAIAVGCWLAGDVHGSHAAELACEKAKTAANAKAVTEWLDAKTAVDAQDAARREKDAAASKAATDRAQAVADRFEKMRIGVIKAAPAGDCTLSPDWLRAFNDAK